MNATKAQFLGTFYDGKSANKYPVDLLLTKAHLELIFPDGRRIAWAYPTLKLSKTGSKGPVRLERSNPNPNIIPQSVVIEDPHFLDAAHQVVPGALGTIWTQPHKRPLRYALMILAVIALPPFIFAIWVYAIPGMTNAVADRIPTTWEEKLGQNYFQTLFKEPLKDPDPEMRKALDAISERLLTAVPDQPYHFRIYVHPSKMVNAMALPGGTIVVFQGLINATETPEELAGVLAHEFQHVLKRHSTRSLVRSEAINLFGLIISGNSDSMTNVILQAGGILEHLRYSRTLESQADAEGMKMMLATRVDPRGMVRVFEKLEEEQHRQLESMKENKSKNKKKSDPKEKKSAKKDSKKKDKEDKVSDEKGITLPEWTKYLSTHPEGEDRVEVLKKMSEHPSQKAKPLLPGFDWKSMHRETKESDFIF
jgi:Zn-dependent protease with chaperone function